MANPSTSISTKQCHGAVHFPDSAVSRGLTSRCPCVLREPVSPLPLCFGSLESVLNIRGDGACLGYIEFHYTTDTAKVHQISAAGHSKPQMGHADMTFMRFSTDEF